MHPYLHLFMEHELALPPEYKTKSSFCRIAKVFGKRAEEVCRLMEAELRSSLGYAGEIAISASESRAEKWRPQCQAVKYSLLHFEIPDKPLLDKALRFNPIQIAEWLSDLLDQGQSHSQVELEGKLGIDRTRIGQFLRLMRLPEDARARLKGIPDLNEFRLRRLLGEHAVLATGAN